MTVSMYVTAMITEKPQFDGRNMYIGSIGGRRLELDCLRKVTSEDSFVSRKPGRYAGSIESGPG